MPTACRIKNAGRQIDGFDMTTGSVSLGNVNRLIY